MDIFAAMKERKSIRAYLDKPVSKRDIDEIFKYAGLAPSAINLQPWEFIVTYGEEKNRLVQRLKNAQAERRITCGPGTTKPLPEKFSRRSCEALEVMEPKITSMGLAFNQFIEEGSCAFYGAPLAVIVTIDKTFPPLRYLDVGLSVSYFLLAVHAKGLAACPIGLITAYADEITDVLNIPEEKEIIMGIALGYADETSSANDFKTTRADLTEIVTWY
jgi:nitroreductase